MAALDELFYGKMTENGDNAFSTTTNNKLDILFMSEYYTAHPTEAHIGNSEDDKWFARFMRDPRHGLGRRDLGRKLMMDSECTFDEIVLSGRYDDIWVMYGTLEPVVEYYRNEIDNGNELAKKWMPRYSSKNLMVARDFAKKLGMNKQEYGHYIKANTVENTLSRKETDKIVYPSVPSLAMVRYFSRFKNGEDTKEAFSKYLESVKKGEAKLNISTTNVYDIYKNRNNIDADIFFEKLEKISGSWLPIIDVSGSMCADDAMGKAISIGHYLSKCSTYTNKVVTFSANPELVSYVDSCYNNEVSNIRGMDWGFNTDLGKVMELLEGLDDVPEYLVILSDMEFDQGSNCSKCKLMKLWKEKGYTTKIIWWNFNGRNKTCPETDSFGNVFISGYSPMLLKYLEVGFDGNAFLLKLVEEYKKKILAM